MFHKQSARRIWRVALLMVAACWGAHTMAQSLPASAKPEGVRAKPAQAAKAVTRGGAGWAVGRVPAWVIEPPAAPATGAPPSGARHEQLADFQSNYSLARPQHFIRIRSVARDAAALSGVSQPQLRFNPAFNKLLLHAVAVVRDGKRMNRLADARIETLRREQRLEQQVLDGSETLLVVLSDVRVGDAVEVAYTIEGENPIFEGRISTGMRLAWDRPVDLLHYRITAPASRPLNTRLLAGASEPERLTEGSNNVLRIVRQQVAAVPSEPGTPPWVKVYPTVDITELNEWSEVDAWAQRLFALPQPTPSAIVAKAAEFKSGGLEGEALASEVLRFVQDDVRYLSMSLGENSHRPKPPQETLAQRQGDCKDKVTLLNALLRELGFDAQPALVSVERNRGLFEHLPAQDIFDHVITRLRIKDQTWYVDATAQGQGTGLDQRGQFSYGAALVVGGATGLTRLPDPPSAVEQLRFEQRWTASEPGRPARVEILVSGVGLPAERLRASVATVPSEQIGQSLASGLLRLVPGIKPLDALRVQDDRVANRIELWQPLEVPEFGQYNRGFIDVEFLAIEMIDVFSGPTESQRRMPYLLDQPKVVEHRISVLGPAPFPFQPPPGLEVVDKHFRYSARVEFNGSNATFVRRFERREDQVAPADLAAWREKLLQARQSTLSRLRLPLIDTAKITPEMEALDRQLRTARGWRNDALQAIVTRNEFGRAIDSRALQRVTAGTALAAKVLASRAQAHNLLGDFPSGRIDAENALAIRLDDADAREALAVALLGEGRAEDALTEFARINPQARSSETAQWMGSIHFHQGRGAQAEALLREAVAGGSGESREFALIWLFLAAESQGGRGKAAVAEHLESVDPKKLTGAILRHFVGDIDQAALLRVASEKPDMERLNLAETHFFLGQRLLLQNQRAEALRAFQRVVDTGATPYREVTFAQLELRRAGR